MTENGNYLQSTAKRGQKTCSYRYRKRASSIFSIQQTNVVFSEKKQVLFVDLCSTKRPQETGLVTTTAIALFACGGNETSINQNPWTSVAVWQITTATFQQRFYKLGDDDGTQP